MTTAPHSGRLELHNSAGQSALEEPLRAELERAFRQELRRPLPPHLTAAHARGFADYFSTARARRRDRRRPAQTPLRTRRRTAGSPEGHWSIRKDSRPPGPPAGGPAVRPLRNYPFVAAETPMTAPAALSACTAT